MRTIMILTITGLLIATGCVKESLCTRGIGQIEIVSLSLDEFNSVNLQGSMDVDITYGETLEVIAEGQPNIIDELETRIINGTWNINLGMGCFTDFDLKIHIRLPLLEKVSLNGSGDIIIGDAAGTPNFAAENYGSGMISVFSLSGTSTVNSKVSGSGDIELRGNFPALTDLNVKSTGSGHFHGFTAAANHCSVKASGSGHCEVYATSTLDVNISGSGNIYYKGHPGINVDDNGSGRLINKN
jgi:hypothetical protein